jgi:peptidoglycan hydrolase-like protein with peptidoglycan-binding domain
MQLTHLVVASAAAVSLGAVAADQPKQQPQAEGAQTQGQTEAQTSQSPEIIKQAQEKLSAQGHDAGPANGTLGAKTQAAVKEFQQSKGLQPSGQLDQPTLAALGVSAGASGGASTGSTSGSSSEQPSAGSAAGSSAEPKAQDQPKEKSNY